MRNPMMGRLAQFTEVRSTQQEAALRHNIGNAFARAGYHFRRAVEHSEAAVRIMEADNVNQQQG